MSVYGATYKRRSAIHPTQPVAVRTPDDGIGGARGWRGAEPERPVSDRSADLCCGIGGGGRAPRAAIGRDANDQQSATRRGQSLG